MGIIRVAVTQGGADTTGIEQIDTQLTSDGKTGWQITRMQAYWENGYTADAADQTLSAILCTQPSVPVPTDAEELARLNWAVSNTAGVAVTYPMDLIKETMAAADRVTVQPTLYAIVASTGTALANLVYFEIEYVEVKLSDVEVLRLLLGGA